MRNLISIKDLSVEEIEKIFFLAKQIKENPQKFSHSLQGKSFALIFHKPSLRTRVSFEVGIFQMGGKTIYLKQEIGFAQRESIKDSAMTLSRYVDGVIIRTFSHQLLLDFVQHSSIAVINALTDLVHPCQALSDLWTIKEKKGDLKKAKIVYIGDGNNVCNSLIYGCAKTKTRLSVATPVGYEPKTPVTSHQSPVTSQKSEIKIINDPQEAVQDADVIYTDVWTSMGKEKEREKRKKDFQGFQINKELIDYAKPDCLIMHCLPAHRGEEISDEVIDGKNSIVFEQAENRLYVQKAILLWLMEQK